MSKTPCSCGAKQAYLKCCGRFIEQDKLPETAEQLMRSRYTAYTQANVDYIADTMCGVAAEGFDKASAKRWAEQANWLGLIVKNTVTEGDEACVEFFAAYELGGQRQNIYEVSEFHRIDGRWFYTDGKKPKCGRNDSCPCGSGKKYKKCCF